MAVYSVTSLEKLSDFRLELSHLSNGGTCTETMEIKVIQKLLIEMMVVSGDALPISQIMRLFTLDLHFFKKHGLFCLFSASLKSIEAPTPRVTGNCIFKLIYHCVYLEDIHGGLF